MERLKVALYCRVAYKETGKNDCSIELQKCVINQYLKSNVQRIKTKEYYIDNGYSGRTFDRPEFRRLIKDIEENRINTIIVKDLARFGRTNNTLDRIEALKRKYGIRFISVTEELNTINKK